MTPELCAQIATKRGWKFFGVEYGEKYIRKQELEAAAV
jgi:hypothetical protein